MKVDLVLLCVTFAMCLMILSEWLRRKNERGVRRRSQWLADMAWTRSIAHAKKWQATKEPIYLELFEREMRVYRANRERTKR